MLWQAQFRVIHSACKVLSYYCIELVNKTVTSALKCGIFAHSWV
uniref:Uncharacterized protein n=1 Tax=Anguilla anguilla TaxID=7936 RepID=A0A0E9UHD0_ANGAN